MSDDNPLAKWIAEQRADNEAWNSRMDAELHRMNRHVRCLWILTAVACLIMFLLGVIVGASR